MKQVKQITLLTRVCTRAGLITHRTLSKQCCSVLQQVRGRGNLNKHSNLVCSPKVRTGRPDHGWTGHFENEKGFFQEFLMKTDFLRVYYLGFDWCGWIAFIKSKTFIKTGTSWPVSSDKWKAPLLTEERKRLHTQPCCAWKCCDVIYELKSQRSHGWNVRMPLNLMSRGAPSSKRQ